MWVEYDGYIHLVDNTYLLHLKVQIYLNPFDAFNGVELVIKFQPQSLFDLCNWHIYVHIICHMNQLFLFKLLVYLFIYSIVSFYI